MLGKANQKGDIDLTEFLDTCNAQHSVNQFLTRLPILTTMLEFIRPQQDLEFIQYFKNKLHIDFKKMAAHNPFDNTTELPFMQKACRLGQFEIVQYLVEECGVHPFRDGRISGFSACIAAAAASGKVQILEYLYTTSVSSLPGRAIQPKWLESAVPEACRNGNFDALKFLVEKGVTLDEMRDKLPNEHPLFLAIPSGNTPLVAYLMENCPFDVNRIIKKFGKFKSAGMARRYSQSDAFILACQNGVTEICEEFFRTDKMPVPTKADVRQGIITAIENKQTEMMTYLLEHKKYHLRDTFEIISKNAWNTGIKCGILALAMRSGCEGMVKYLVDIGAMLSLEELIISVFETKVWNNRDDFNLKNLVYIIQQNNLINIPVLFQGDPEWGLSNNYIHFRQPKLSPHFIGYLIANGYKFLDIPDLPNDEDDADWLKVYQMLWDSIHAVDSLKSLCRTRVSNLLGVVSGAKWRHFRSQPISSHIF